MDSPMEPMGLRFSDESLPAAYDRIFRPRMFEPWAHELIDFVGMTAGESVLDVATGPGTVARVAATRVGTAGRVIGSDISEPMLEIARQKPPQPGAAPVAFVRAPADALEFAEASFDVVLCQQGLQFFPDRIAALREMRRVLRPGGRVGLAVWAKGYGREVEQVLSECLARAGGNPPPFPTFGIEPNEVLAALSEAGFSSIQCEERTLELVFPSSIDDVIESVAASPARPELLALIPEQAARFRECAVRQLQRYIHGEELRSPSVSRLAKGSR
jgi:ubiquinone/menaquinone biosynthesis C-methylase UbiE